MYASQSIPEISVEEFSHRLAENSTENLQLVDVREPKEVEIASLDGFLNLPLSQAQQWSQEIEQYLQPQTETFVLCHHGMRSAQMCQWLIGQGFKNVRNITGGIDAYSALVDSNIPRY
ncbi:MAG: rhodanese-like domain-containing protein [Microcoleaceae cyanobacterium]